MFGIEKTNSGLLLEQIRRSSSTICRFDAAPIRYDRHKSGQQFAFRVARTTFSKTRAIPIPRLLWLRDSQRSIFLIDFDIDEGKVPRRSSESTKSIVTFARFRSLRIPLIETIDRLGVRAENHTETRLVKVTRFLSIIAKRWR